MNRLASVGAGAYAGVFSSAAAAIAEFSQSDAGKYHRLTHPSPTITVEAAALGFLGVGGTIQGVGTAGQITFAAGVGVVINTAESLKTRKAMSPFCLTKVSASEFDLTGDLELGA